IVYVEDGRQFIVEKMLGKGGFGEVYKVHSSKDPDKKLAMKVEKRELDPKKKNSHLRLKIDVFLRVERVADSFCDKTHFVKMHAKGNAKTFTFYVMDLIWASLRDIVEDILKNVSFSPSTKIQIARQTLKGIEALHELGYIYRDIKSANFAVGLPPNDNIIYLTDFGIARPYRNEITATRLRQASMIRIRVLRYASARALEHQEQSRRDDLEVWMYMMIQV
ncbi:hypothetical protein PMAYCL1PPCAC_20570, partial [Pristionchus mayeri]